MSLRVALVIDGDQSGAKRALEDTASGIGKVQEAAGKAAPPVKQIGEGLKDTATEAGNAKTAVGDLGSTADGAGIKFSNLRTLAIGAVGGIAGALATAALETVFDLATTSAIAYFDEVTNSATNIKADLAAHKDLIGGVKALWDEAAGAASSYGANSRPVLALEAGQNIDRLSGDLGSELGRVGSIDFVSNPFRLSGGLVDGKPSEHPLEATLLALKEDLADGMADIIHWRDEIARIAGETELGSDARRVAAEFIEKTQTAVELQRSVDIFKALTGDADAAATAMGAAADKMTVTGENAAAALPALREYDALLRSINQVTVTVGGVQYTGAPGSIGGSYAAGGKTGRGANDEVAGLVHRNEYVFDAAATARIGVHNLEAIRSGSFPGYAMGGYVGSGGGSAAVMASGGFSVVDELIQDLGVLSGAVTDFVGDLWETRDPLQALGSVIQSVSQSFLNSALGAVAGAADNAFSGFLNGLVSSLFGGGQLQLGYQAGVLHTGGAPEAPSVTRWMPASLFANAPRLHTGLASDEFPTILQEGETVIPRGGRVASSGGTVVNNWNIETPSPRAFMESRASLARAAGRLSASAWRHS